MNARSFEAEDHRKFNYALLSRDIRRLNAKIHRADIDDETRQMIDAALEQLENRLWAMAFHDPATGDLIPDQDCYADGRRVTTTISLDDRFVTLVHSRRDPWCGRGAFRGGVAQWPRDDRRSGRRLPRHAQTWGRGRGGVSATPHELTFWRFVEEAR